MKEEGEMGKPVGPRYYVRDRRWVEVSKEEFVRHERSAGFVNTMGEPDEPATGGFSSTRYDYEGTVTYGRDPNE
jgi:hypothetical protein